VHENRISSSRSSVIVYKCKCNYKLSLCITGGALSMHVKTGDKVTVLSGKDKGKQGTIIQAFPKKERVLVEEVNMLNIHSQQSQENQQDGILNVEAKLHVSTVM